MTFPSHILAASDRCKQLREKIWEKEAILEYLAHDRWWGEGHEPKQVKQFLALKVREMKASIKNLKEVLFRLEEDLTKDVLVEQFIQKQRTNLKYSKPSDLLLA